MLELILNLNSKFGLRAGTAFELEIELRLRRMQYSVCARGFRAQRERSSRSSLKSVPDLN